MDPASHTSFLLEYEAKFKDDDGYNPEDVAFRQKGFSGATMDGKKQFEHEFTDQEDDIDVVRNGPAFSGTDEPGFEFGNSDTPENSDDDIFERDETPAGEKNILYIFSAYQEFIDKSRGGLVLARSQGPPHHLARIKGTHPRAETGVPFTAETVIEPQND
ncbi:MAG: hypothetical protein KDD06_01915 [Phaeodactylibacter sp.]|nr:hypothetical protein [Phaeodactylibacter sp.]MCB9267268.1 hypothetical protein [Lewinellaceae bacterium]MCB9285671.1 hypothetical protein [Lewinellaceae bacterium]